MEGGRQDWPGIAEKLILEGVGGRGAHEPDTDTDRPTGGEPSTPWMQVTAFRDNKSRTTDYLLTTIRCEAMPSELMSEMGPR